MSLYLMNDLMVAHHRKAVLNLNGPLHHQRWSSLNSIAKLYVGVQMMWDEN